MTSGGGLIPLELEMEDEQESLLAETSGIGSFNNTKLSAGGSNLGMRKRATSSAPTHGSSNNQAPSFVLGFLRGDLSSTAARSIGLICILGVFALLNFYEEDIFVNREALHVESVKKQPHQTSFGGKNNMAQYDSNEDDDIHLYHQELQARYWDLSHENIRNDNGHYWHDPLVSPFVTDLYYVENMTELDDREALFDAKLDKVRKNYGVWTAPNSDYDIFPHPDFYDNYDYGDVPIDDFGDEMWQKDPYYIQDFIFEAQELVKRVKHGIIAEYGHDPNKPGDVEKFSVKTGKCKKTNGIAVDDTGGTLKGIACMKKNAWDGLIRKLLHGLITTDLFYVVVVGSAATYRANNMLHTQVMQFNYIMEPVFDKLGMTLVSRNMGMDASADVYAMGGNSILGEADILWHFEGFNDEEEEKTFPDGVFDLLQKQMILSGDRIPIIMSPKTTTISKDTDGLVWEGNLQPSTLLCKGKEVTACKNLYCNAQELEEGKCNVYNSKCWEERNDWNPKNPDDIDENAGFQDVGYPSVVHHQWEGRKMSLVLLWALEEALGQWESELEFNLPLLPMDPQYWHLGSTYDEIRISVSELDSLQESACELLLKRLNPLICQIPMRAYTEWTPRVKPEHYSLFKIATNDIPEGDLSEVYTGLDVLPLEWQLGEDEVDVHLIAIATNYSDDDYYVDDFLGDDFYFDGLPPDDDIFQRHLEQSTLTKRVVSDNRDHKSKKPRRQKDRAIRKLSSGAGWGLWHVPVGFCDGSAQSRCNRKASNSCLLANHNHYKAGLIGHLGSAWLRMKVGPVKYGMILARLEFVDENGKQLRIVDLPDDFLLQWQVDGTKTSLGKNDLSSGMAEISSGLTVFPLLMDEELSQVVDEMDVEGYELDVALRISSNETAADVAVVLSHIYFA